MTYEGLRLKLLKIKRIKFAESRKKGLKLQNFTIISNNCWGGMIYESYNIIKQTPTAGLFFMAEDYIKFVSDLKKYTSSDIEFIEPASSKWYKSVCSDSRYGSYPVGRIGGDVEIFFLHYHSKKEAAEKWKRRCERINWDKMLVKFNDQNGCRKSDLEAFLKLPYKNKLFFTCKDWGIDSKEIIKINQFPKHDFIMASYEPFGKTKKINVTDVLNNL